MYILCTLFITVHRLTGMIRCSARTRAQRNIIILVPPIRTRNIVTHTFTRVQYIRVFRSEKTFRGRHNPYLTC